MNVGNPLDASEIIPIYNLNVAKRGQVAQVDRNSDNNSRTYNGGAASVDDISAVLGQTPRLGGDLELAFWDLRDYRRDRHELRVVRPQESDRSGVQRVATAVERDEEPGVNEKTRHGTARAGAA